MNLLDITHRQSAPQPWAEGEKIPWNDLHFSRRMLDEHLSQAHDAASRRFEIIDQHVRWIHEAVLQGKPTRILDLGCGPGLYTYRLAQLGHTCVGIDFSPASIAYASAQAVEAGLDCQYVHQDIRTADYGAGFGLVMSIYGEFNVFRPQEAKLILVKAHRALLPQGFLLLEPHPFEVVEAIGKRPPTWYSAGSGLFSARPHICLQENFWNTAHHVAIERYYILDAGTGEVTAHSSSMQAYTDQEYESLLKEEGFGQVTFYPALGRSAGSPAENLIAILAQKGVA